MTEKNKIKSVSKEMMEELSISSKVYQISDLKDIINNENLSIATPEISKWYLTNPFNLSDDEKQSKLVGHIWFNDPQFEEEKANKYVVRSKEADDQGDFIYLSLEERYGLAYSTNTYDFYMAEKFDTREEAEKWKNPLTEVVEVEE